MPLSSHQNRNVSDWTTFSPSFQRSLKKGDLVEINRVIYSHWGMYCGQGQVAHFKPSSSNRRVGPMLDPENFVPGKVMQTPLQFMSGISSIRVNNKPEYPGKARSLDNSMALVKILKNAPGLWYSMARFNAENFVIFLKFEGPKDSPQAHLLRKTCTKNWMETVKNRSHSKVIAGGGGQSGQESIWNQLAYFQWWENASKAYRRQSPRLLLEMEDRDCQGTDHNNIVDSLI